MSQIQNTILAALRCLQSNLGVLDDAIVDIATNGGEEPMMEESGIDVLCEDINTGAAVVVPDADGAERLTEEEVRVIRNIRSRGFAIIIWTPGELGDADPDHVQDRSIELGWDVIRDLGGGPEEKGGEDGD